MIPEWAAVNRLTKLQRAIGAKPKGSANMIKKVIVVLFFAVLLMSAPGNWAGQDDANRRMYDLNQKKELRMSQALADLKKNRIVLVGEHHSNRQHHMAQLAVIRALKEAGLRVAVGLEMFRKESQPALDQWIYGEIDAERFEKIYYDNWNFPWQAYRKIFEYARNHKIPMIGLNVPREITRQVSRNGFKSLSPQQKVVGTVMRPVWSTSPSVQSSLHT